MTDLANRLRELANSCSNPHLYEKERTMLEAAEFIEASERAKQAEPVAWQSKVAGVWVTEPGSSRPEWEPGIEVRPLYAAPPAVQGEPNLREFARDILDDFPDSFPDGFGIQDLAVKHGVLVGETKTAPCRDEGCACAEYHGDMSEGVTCYRLAPSLFAAPPAVQGDQLTIADYEEVLDDHRRLVRELDVIWNGEDGAAKQASLCDIVAQIRRERHAAPPAAQGEPFKPYPPHCQANTHPSLEPINCPFCDSKRVESMVQRLCMDCGEACFQSVQDALIAPPAVHGEPEPTNVTGYAVPPADDEAVRLLREAQLLIARAAGLKLVDGTYFDKDCACTLLYAKIDAYLARVKR